MKIFELSLETSHHHVVFYITASGILDSILAHRVSQYSERQEAYQKFKPRSLLNA